MLDARLKFQEERTKWEEKKRKSDTIRNIF